MSKPVYVDVDHPRARDGKWRAKVNEAPTGSLTGQPPVSGPEIAHTGACIEHALVMAGENGAADAAEAREWVSAWDADGGLGNYGACSCHQSGPGDERVTFTAFLEAEASAPAEEPAPAEAGAPVKPAPAGTAAPAERRQGPKPQWQGVNRAVNQMWNVVEREIDETVDTAKSIFD